MNTIASEAFNALHAEVQAWLPWYVNGTLDPVAKARVEQHLRECLPCRHERGLLEALATHTRTIRPDAECEAALRRLSARIHRAPVTPRPWPWATAAVIALCTSLMSWAADNAHESTAWLRNAGHPALIAGADDVPGIPLGPQVNLVFYDDVTERELRSLVLAVGAAVIEGPTPEGRYTLAFLRQMSPGELLAALRHLRDSRQVLVAEPAETARISAANY